MIFRETSAERYNEVLNDPSVHPSHKVDEKIDVSPLVANGDNVLLGFPGGGFLFVKIAAAAYNVHPNAIASARGKTADRLREAIYYMFAETDALVISMHIPPENSGAKKLADRAGFVCVDKRQEEFDVYTLDIRGFVRDEYRRSHSFF